MIRFPFFHGTMLQVVWREIVGYTLFTVVMVVFDFFLYDLSNGRYRIPFYGTAFQVVAVFSFFIAFLIQFRNNWTYQRFHEGREQWGSIVNDARNFSIMVMSLIDSESEAVSERKLSLVLNVNSLVYTIKMRLNRKPVEFPHIPFYEYLPETISRLNHYPNAIVMHIEKSITDLYKMGLFSDYVLTTLLEPIKDIVNRYGACERILGTPLPQIYQILLFRSVHLYMVWLAIGLVSHDYFASLVVIPVASYLLFGFAGIGSQLENPFTDSPFTFDQNTIINTIKQDLIEIAGL